MPSSRSSSTPCRKRRSSSRSRVRSAAPGCSRATAAGGGAATRGGEQVAHPQQHLLGLERFRDEVAGPLAQGQQPARRRAVSGEDDDGRKSSASTDVQIRQDGEPVAVRHHQVEQHDVRIPSRAETAAASRASSASMERETRLQQPSQQQHVGGLVINDQGIRPAADDLRTGLHHGLPPWIWKRIYRRRASYSHPDRHSLSERLPHRSSALRADARPPLATSGPSLASLHSPYLSTHPTATSVAKWPALTRAKGAAYE